MGVSIGCRGHHDTHDRHRPHPHGDRPMSESSDELSERSGELDGSLPDGSAGSVTRRAPFADSPYVGERGHRAQMRILDAALEVFGEVGYHACGVRAITELSGCSRASFYQYFSSKEDLFRHLAG